MDNAENDITADRGAPVPATGRGEMASRVADRGDHEQRELAARHAEKLRLFDRVLSSITDFAYTFDTDGRFTYVNKPLLDLWGLTLEQAVGKNFFDLKYPDDLAAKLQRQIQHVIETGQRVVDETPYTSLTGAGGFYQYIFSPVFATDGTVEAVAGSTRDVTERKRAEETIRESVHRYRTLFTSIDEGFCLCEMIVDDTGRPVDYRFLEVNPAFERLTGLAAAEGRTARDLVPDLEDRWVETYARVGLGGETLRFEQGSEAMGRWFIVFASPAGPAGSGKFALIFNDITARKRAEDALAAERGRLREIIDLAPSFMCVLRGPSFIFEVANEAYHQVSGHRDVIGLSIREAFPEVEGQGFFELIERVYATGEPWVGNNVPILLQREPDAAPEQRYLDLVYQALREADGSISGVFAHGVDITERKRAEEAIREGAARLEFMLEAAQVGDWDLDLINDTSRRSLRHDQCFGYNTPVKKWGFNTFIQHVHPDDRERVEAEFRAAITDLQDWRFECRVIWPDGSVHWIGAHGSIYRTPDEKARRMLGIIFDITERKRAEAERERLLEAERRAKDEAERASEAKSEFLATLSHELRTPLTPVLLTVSIMESHPQLPSDLRDDVALIRRNVELESRLISDLLDLTRIERGKLQLDMQDLDLHLIVRSAIDICQREASAKLMVELRATCHTVRGDGTRLQQIFWNLINNAQKFTKPEGMITVRSTDLPGGMIRVEVSDTGAGIDAALLPKLFDAFEQGEVRAMRQQAGLGLGLTISRRLAEAHGGTITASSAGRGHGAIFAVELPVVARLVPDFPAARNTPGAAAGRSLAVLLVEDHEPTLTVLSKLLRNLGHHVKGVTSVASATAAAGQDAFDVIISDLGLPDGSGLDVMRHLRDRYAGRAIALTGYGMESDITASRDAGFAEHLTKPVDLTALQAAIQRVAPRLS